MSEYLKTRYGSFPHCGSCVCQKCLYWWSGRCPEGECYDDKRAKEEPYNKAFPERSPRTQWSNWNLPGEQAHWCRGGTFFIIQYHGETRDGDSRGQLLTEPIKTIDTSNRYGLVTAFVTKYYKSGIGQGCDEPLHTITTSPGHFGLVSAFLIKYYGAGCGQMLDHPLGTITTKDRFGLVNVILEIKGEKYIIYDIFLRMLKPEELKLMQGFPRDYIINRDYNFKSYPVAKQVARIGNSVVPIMAQKLVEANCPYLKVGERVPNLNIDDSQGQLRFA